MSKKFYEQTWFIVLILIVFFPAGLVLVWTNKQWSQKGKIIATVIVAVLVILGLGGRSRSLKGTQPENVTNVTEATSETTTQEETTTLSETTVQEETTTAESEEETDIDTHESVRQLIETVSAMYFQDISVTYDEETDSYIVNVCQEGVASDLTAVRAGTLERSTWDQVVDTMVDDCNSMKGVVEKAELDSNVMLNILNDQNRDNVLLSIINGTVIYNAADD